MTLREIIYFNHSPILCLIQSLCLEQTDETVHGPQAVTDHGAGLVLPDVNALGNGDEFTQNHSQNAPILPPLGPPAVNTRTSMNAMNPQNVVNAVNAVNTVNAVNALNAVPGLPVLGPAAHGNLDWFGHDENVNTLNGNDQRFELNNMFTVCFMGYDVPGMFPEQSLQFETQTIWNLKISEF